MLTIYVGGTAKRKYERAEYQAPQAYIMAGCRTHTSVLCTQYPGAGDTHGQSCDCWDVHASVWTPCPYLFLTPVEEQCKSKQNPCAECSIVSEGLINLHPSQMTKSVKKQGHTLQTLHSIHDWVHPKVTWGLCSEKIHPFSQKATYWSL